MSQRTNGRSNGHRAVGYVRRSTDRQEQSIPDQKKALEAYAAEHGLRLGKYYVDDRPISNPRPARYEPATRKL